MFDIQAFLHSESIFYRDSGENCKAGHVVVNCPFCIEEGRGDEGQHMGIELATGAWGCWRNARHRGRNLPFLVSKLARISVAEAAKLVGSETPMLSASMARRLYDSKNLLDVVSSAQQEVPVGPEFIEWPPEIHSMSESACPERFYTYLEHKRGFRKQDLDSVVDTYDLHYAIEGDFRERIILPVYYQGRLVTFTGRHIGHSTLRYRSLDKESSAVPIFDMVGNYDTLCTHTGVFVLVEGPLDMMKFDFYAQPYGVRAGCIFSKTLSAAKVGMLARISRTARKAVIGLDHNEGPFSMRMAEELTFFAQRTLLPYPPGVKDPGDMTPRQVIKIAKTL